MLDITLRILAARLEEMCNYESLLNRTEEDATRRAISSAKIEVLGAVSEAIKYALDEVKTSIEKLSDS